MTNEEAIRMLKAKLECMIRDVSGSDDDCNRKLCGECPLNYEKGNMGEQKEYLRMSIEALEQIGCLKDRPCDVCKHNKTENGCTRWECVFKGV